MESVYTSYILDVYTVYDVFYKGIILLVVYPIDGLSYSYVLLAMYPARGFSFTGYSMLLVYATRVFLWKWKGFLSLLILIILQRYILRMYLAHGKFCHEKTWS